MGYLQPENHCKIAEQQKRPLHQATHFLNRQRLQIKKGWGWIMQLRAHFFNVHCEWLEKGSTPS